MGDHVKIRRSSPSKICIIRRNTHDANYKLMVIKYAEETNNVQAARKYGLCESNVRRWRLQKEKLKLAKSTRCAFSGPKTGYFQAIEERVCEYVKSLRRQGLPVTREVLQMKALEVATELKIPRSSFKASVGWSSRMMKRCGFSLRRPKTLAQKLPTDDYAKCDDGCGCSTVFISDWESEQVAVMFPDGRVIRVCSGDPESCWTTVETVLEKANDELGILFTSKLSKDASAYLYVREGHVLGCVIAEPIQVAYYMLENGGNDIVKVEIPDDDEIFVVIETSSFCSNTPIRGNLCGINRMWTCVSERRNGIATKMLDAIRTTFVDGHILRRDEIAFADPTPLGIAFAQKYTKLPNILTYKLNKD